MRIDTLLRLMSERLRRGILMPCTTIKEHLSLSDMAVAPGTPLTTGDRFLAKFGIHPEDKTVTLLTFSNTLTP